MTNLDSFLQAYPAELHPLVHQARALIQSVMPAALEMLDPSANLIAYGTDRTIKGLVCGIIIYPTYLNLMLARGASLPDPHHILKGSGKKARHVRIHTPADLHAPAVRAILQAAINATDQS